MIEASIQNRVFGDRFRATKVIKEDRGIATLLGTDLERETQVIIKTAAAQTVSVGMQIRLEHEAEVLGRVSSPHLTSLLHVGREQGLLYLVTPFVPGVTLEQRLHSGPLAVEDAITVGLSVMAALHEAHEHGVLHRDVKPANVIVDEESPLEQATLIDFGLARSTRLSASIRDLPVGTATYMSPEQAGLVHHEVDERSDLYCAGVLLFECLAGQPPFTGRTVGEVLRNHVTADPPDLGDFGQPIPYALSEVVQHLLRKDPRDRYQSAAAVSADLREIGKALDRGVEEPEVVVGLQDRRRTLTDPAFIGREQELAALEAAIDSAQNGEAGLVLLEAESGRGKTRLLEELSRRAAQRGAWLLRGQGLDQVGQNPLQVLDGVLREVALFAESDSELAGRIRQRVRGHEDALRAAAPQLAGVVGEPRRGSPESEEHGALRTVRALVSLVDSLSSSSRPALLLLDDCQWADELTLDAIRTWYRQARGTNRTRHVLVVAAFRSEDVSAGHPLREGESSVRMVLPPLDAGDVRNLIESMGGVLPDGVIELVLRLSDGSPFMAEEVLRGLVESGALMPEEEGWRVDPERMTDVQSSRRAAVFLARRLERLPPGTLRLLSLGAVLGQSFELEAVQALTGESSHDAMAALHEAERRHVLWADAQGTAFAFVHDKLREALLERLSDQERRTLHLAAAERIKSLHPERVFELAYHFDSAGKIEQALPHALAAAEQARTRHALEIAEHQYRIAERGAELSDPATRQKIFEGLADVLILRGQYAEAERYFGRAHTLAEDVDVRARIDGKLGDLAIKRGDVSLASESVERALLLLGQPVPRQRLAIILMLVQEVLVQLLHTALPWVFVGRRKLHRAEGDLLAARLYSRLAHSYWFERGQVHCSWAHLRGMNLAERYPPTPELAQSYSEHVPVMTMLPYYRRGLAYGYRSLEIRKTLGDVWGQGQSLHFIGIGLYAASRFEEAIEKCGEAVRIFDRTGDRWEANSAGWHIAFCLYRLGRLAEAVATAQRIHRSGLQIGDGQATGISLGAWAKASAGQVPQQLLRTELERPAEDALRAAEVLQAEGVRLLWDEQPKEAAEVLERAQRLVKLTGLRQEYVAPVLPWLATAIRNQLEGTSPWDPGQRRAVLRRGRRVARKGVRMARSFRNNLPHALREAGLLAAMGGRPRRARRLLERSLAAAEKQGASHERAQTLLARGRVGLVLGWAGAAEDVPEGRRLLRMLRRGLEPDRAEEPDAVTVSLVERFSGVLEHGRQIASALTPDAVFAAVRDAALLLLRAERCVILGVEPGRGVEGVRPVDRYSDGDWSRSVVARALDVGEPIVFTEESGDDPSESAILARVPSVLCAPILVRGEIAACFYLVHEEIGGLFSEEEERLARFVSVLAGAALENAEGFAEIEELSRSLERRVEERTAELRKLAAIIESSDDGIISKDLDGIVLSWNPGAERMYGYSAEEMVGRPLTALMPPGHEDELERVLEIVKRSEALDYYETRRVAKDGSLLDVALTVSPVRDESGRVIGVSSIAKDITQMKQADRFRQAQHAVTRVLAEATSVEEVVPKVLQMLGEQMSWEIGEFWEPDEREAILRCSKVWHMPALELDEFEAITRTMTVERGGGLPGRVWTTGAPTLVEELSEDSIFMRAETARRYGLETAIALPIRSRANLVGVMVFFSRKAKVAGEGLMEMMETLSSQVGQFIERKRAEEEAERLKDEFFSLVSHEFRTPLTSIIGYIDLLTEDDEAGLTEEHREQFLQVIKRNSERLSRLVNDLLLISKVQAGKFSIAPRTVDVHEIVEHSLDAARPVAKENGLSLVLEAGDLPPLWADPDRLAQLFDNLVSNALKYTPAGEQVKVSVATEGDQVAAEVTNTGTYIEPDELSRLFESFYRASTASSREAPGVGLGLTIAEAIVKAHDGRITVLSTQEAGTTFRVVLPIRQVEEDKFTPEVGASAGSGR